MTARERRRRTLLVLALLTLAFGLRAAAPSPAHLRFAVIGDSLAASTASWRIAFVHHPLYSSGGRHGSAPDLRAILEPLCVQGGVQVVFSGHDHVYERVKAQHGDTVDSGNIVR